MIEVSDRDGVAVVRWERGKVNALDLEFLEEIAKTVEGLADADAVVLTGAGRAFSAGVDLRRLVDGGPEHVAAFLPALSRALLAVFDCPRPVVAAVGGHAIAGGAMLAVAADHRIMSGGTIGFTELLVGVPFPAVPFEIVRWAAGPAADSLVVTGRTVKAPEAAALGLVHEVVEPADLLETAVRRAAAFARVPRGPWALTKSQLHREANRAIAAGADWDAEVLAVWQSAETLGGMAAYLDGLAARSG